MTVFEHFTNNLLCSFKTVFEHFTYDIPSSQESLPGQSSASDFKDAANPRFDHSNVVFDLFLETRFCI